MIKENIRMLDKETEKVVKAEKVIKDTFPIQTDRLIIRKYRLSDVFEFWKHTSSAELYKYLNCKRMREFDEAQAYVMNSIRNYAEPWITRLVIADKSNNKLLGVISIYVRIYADNQVSHEIGYWVGGCYAGHGIATEAVKAVTSIIAKTGYPIYLDIMDANKASVGVAQKVGYDKVGYSSIKNQKGETIRVGKYKFIGGIQS